MNVRSKLAVGLSISTVMVSATFRETWPILAWALTALPVVWMILLKRWRMVVTCVLLLCSCYVEFFPVIGVYAMRLPWMILLFMTIFRHFIPGIAVGVLIVQTTSISEYMNGLSRMRIPAAVALATSVIFRFVPTIRGENAGIKQALRMRRLTGLNMLRHPLRFLNYRLTPLLLSTSRIGDELSMASLCRGLSTSRQRTSYERDTLRLPDWVVIVLSGLLLLLWLVTLIVVPAK